MKDTLASLIAIGGFVSYIAGRIVMSFVFDFARLGVWEWFGQVVYRRDLDYVVAFCFIVMYWTLFFFTVNSINKRNIQSPKGWKTSGPAGGNKPSPETAPAKNTDTKQHDKNHHWKRENQVAIRVNCGGIQIWALERGSRRALRSSLISLMINGACLGEEAWIRRFRSRQMRYVTAWWMSLRIRLTCLFLDADCSQMRQAMYCPGGESTCSVFV